MYFRPAQFFMKWKLLSALLGVLLAQAATATIPLYQNLDVLNYLIPGTPPPPIDATAFDNENQFTVGIQIYTANPELYEPWNTLNYTNTDTMVANCPTATNGVLTIGLNTAFGSGFQFDLQTTNQISHQMAGTLYNPGTIRCDSIQDNNNLFNLGGGFLFYLVTSLGQCKAWATNVIIPGTIDVGTGGLIQLNGQNVDLTGGSLSIENLLSAFGTNGALGAVTVNAVGAKGVETNAFWDPGVLLTPVTAQSAFVPISPFYLTLTNSQAYYDLRSPSPTYNVYRYVFVQNNSPNAPYNVYIDAPNTVDLGFEGGAAHVEWVGTYTDPASGSPVTDYLYLTDDYVEGASTNAYFGGVPDNFSFLTWPTELLFNPKPVANPFIPFPDGFVTNVNYAYFNGVLSASSVTTNANNVNPSGNITNLPGAIKISASNVLNLAYSTLSGANYLSLNCTNQFAGSPGASIAAPYSDISLGVTNGNMVVSNLLMAAIPNWSGNVQAWSTIFSTVDAFGVTNEYRVMLVYSALQPTTSPWIQNLYLHGTNLVVSDPLNVFGSFYSDAQTLTLNTNLVGVGASSLDGELNWYGTAAFNVNSANGSKQQMPNLLYLTNNGAIRALNTANFGVPVVNTISSTPGVAASATLTEAGTNTAALDSVTIGANTYVFVGVVTNTIANQIKIATNFDGTLNNLISAINRAAGAGTNYSTNTVVNQQVSAGSLTSHAFTVTALASGSAGNSIMVRFTPHTAAVNLSWQGFSLAGGTLTGGVDYVPAVTNALSSALDSFINNSLVADQGAVIWSTNFMNCGTLSNGVGSFTLQSRSVLLTNGNLVAGGDVVLVATNFPGSSVGGSMIISNLMIQAGRKLTIVTTNLTDTGVTNGNIWVVGTAGIGGTSDSGFNITVKPPAGDLLGTTVTNISPPSKSIYNVWAGNDYGLSTKGYTNNLALGQLILDAQGPSSFFNYSGAGVSNALYVDKLVLQDYANVGTGNSKNYAWLKIATNMIIYFAQAIDGNGNSVAEAIDNASRAGFNNGGRLRWVYSYAGYYSSTNLVYADGTTNTVNAALAQSSTIDSDGDGTVNSVDPTPFLEQSEAQIIALTVTKTNLPPLAARVQWATDPTWTNFIYYKTSLLATNWLPLTNFMNYYYGNNVAFTNAAHANSFMSPQPYVSGVSELTNVWIFDPITNVPHYYRVVVSPWLNYPY